MIRPIRVDHTNLFKWLLKLIHFLEFLLSSPNETRDLGLVQMVERGGNNNTGEGVKGKKARTVSDDVGGKSVSEKSRSRWKMCG